jgi:lysophospholipase L1-like esterase
MVDIMVNRARARRAFDLTLLVLLVLTFSFDQALFNTRAKPRHKAAPSRAASSGQSQSISGAAGDQTRRNIGLFFDKLRAGVPVTVAYLGGSITAGAGASNLEKTSFRALVTDWLRKNHPKSEITELNAAINNTGSSGGSLYGALRARRDLIAYKPDLVFVEFAVNDTNEDEAAARKAIEGLLRQLLVVAQPPEVVMLYATNAKRGVRAEWHETIASHYRVPSINLQNRVWAMIEEGKTQPAELWPASSRPSASWKDTVTPSDAGHRLYADLITSFLADQEKTPPAPLMRSLPPPLISDEMNYGEFKAIVEIKPERGSAREHGATWRAELNNDRTLPAGLLVSDKAGAQVEYYFEGSVIGLSYRAGPDCGVIECLIDGKPAPAPLARVDTYSRTSQLGARIIAGGLGPGEHKLTIRVLGEKNPKSSGNIVRLGYLLIGGTRPEKL